MFYNEDKSLIQLILYSPLQYLRACMHVARPPNSASY